MKKLVLGLLTAAMVSGMASCGLLDSVTGTSTDDVISAITSATNKVQISVEELPEAIQTYLQQNTSPIEAEVAFRAPGHGYEVALEDGNYCYFDGDNNFLGDQNGGPENHPNGGFGGHHGHHGGGCHEVIFLGDTITLADAPTAVSDYLTANYADLTVELVVLKASGKFVILLSDGTVVFFDADGNFIFDHTPGEGHPHFGDSTEVELDSTVVDTTGGPCGGFGGGFGHPGGGGPGHHDGPGFQNGTEITFAELPQAAQDYINTTYAGVTVEKVIEKNNGNFLVLLDGHIRVLFDADGNMLFDSGN